MHTPVIKLEQLVQNIQKCTICVDTLPFGAKILIIGQASGIKAHQSGVPFDDPSGNRLRNWMGIYPLPFKVRNFSGN
jgi:uracil-DNA glycosylase